MVAPIIAALLGLAGPAAATGLAAAGAGAAGAATATAKAAKIAQMMKAAAEAAKAGSAVAKSVAPVNAAKVAAVDALPAIHGSAATAAVPPMPFRTHRAPPSWRTPMGAPVPAPVNPAAPVPARPVGGSTASDYGQAMANQAFNADMPFLDNIIHSRAGRGIESPRLEQLRDAILDRRRMRAGEEGGLGGLLGNPQNIMAATGVLGLLGQGLGNIGERIREKRRKRKLSREHKEQKYKGGDPNFRFDPTNYGLGGEHDFFRRDGGGRLGFNNGGLVQGYRFGGMVGSSVPGMQNKEGFNREGTFGNSISGSVLQPTYGPFNSGFIPNPAQSRSPFDHHLTSGGDDNIAPPAPSLMGSSNFAGVTQRPQAIPQQGMMPQQQGLMGLANRFPPGLAQLLQGSQWGGQRQFGRFG